MWILSTKSCNIYFKEYQGFQKYICRADVCLHVRVCMYIYVSECPHVCTSMYVVVCVPILFTPVMVQGGCIVFLHSWNSKTNEFSNHIELCTVTKNSGVTVLLICVELMQILEGIMIFVLGFLRHKCKFSVVHHWTCFHYWLRLCVCLLGLTHALAQCLVFMNMA